MNIPLFDILNRLDIQSFVALTVGAIFLFYFAVTRKIYLLFFILILSSAFVASSIPIVANISTLVRWGIIFMLLVSGFLFGKMKISFGVLLILGYTYLGFISLLFAKDPIWQYQRGFLLLLTTIAIWLAFGDKSFNTYKLSFTGIAIVAALFSIYSFMPLPNQIGVGTRFASYFKAAPAFAMVLGGLLPFTYWGLWAEKNLLIKVLCTVGFLLGTVTLLFSGQRAGTVAGFIGLVPLLLLTIKKKLSWVLLIVFFIFFVFLINVTGSASTGLQFLQSRYSLESGLSNREQIWSIAIQAIMKQNPLLGRGVGAAETLVSNSFHNTYLEIWFNSGIFGFIFYLFAQIYYLYRVILLRWTPLSWDVQLTLSLTLGYMLGFCVLGLFESIGATASTLNYLVFLFLGVYISNKELFAQTPSQISRYEPST